MPLTLDNALKALEKSRYITRDPVMYYALKSFFRSWASNRKNADLQLITFKGTDITTTNGWDSGIGTAHRLYVVWGKKGNTSVPTYLAVYDPSGSGGSGGNGPSLGDAQRFAVLGATTDTNTGPTVIVGDLGLSPGTSVTGFPPGTVTGTKHITDPTAAAAQVSLVTTYNALAALPSTETLSPGVVIGSGGTRPSFTAGVYDWATAGQLTGAVTLTGSATDVFVFRAGSTMTTASASSVVLAGGAIAANVFWLVGSSATIGTTTTMIGNVVALTSITAANSATVQGRLLARNGAVTMDTNTISLANAGGAGTSLSADGRKSMPFLEPLKEDIEIISNGIPMVNNTLIRAYTTFDGVTNSQAVDAPLGFIIVGHPVAPTF